MKEEKIPVDDTHTPKHENAVISKSAFYSRIRRKSNAERSKATYLIRRNKRK